MSLLADLREWQRKLDNAPPLPQRIIARHDVPPNRGFRMWSTRGEFVVYVNRAQMELTPRVHKDPNPFAAAPIAAFGIPVVVE